MLSHCLKLGIFIAVFVFGAFAVRGVQAQTAPAHIYVRGEEIVWSGGGPLYAIRIEDLTDGHTNGHVSTCVNYPAPTPIPIGQYGGDMCINYLPGNVQSLRFKFDPSHRYRVWIHGMTETGAYSPSVAAPMCWGMEVGVNDARDCAYYGSCVGREVVANQDDRISIRLRISDSSKAPNVNRFWAYNTWRATEPNFDYAAFLGTSPDDRYTVIENDPGGGSVFIYNTTPRRLVARIRAPESLNKVFVNGFEEPAFTFHPACKVTMNIITPPTEVSDPPPNPCLNRQCGTFGGRNCGVCQPGLSCSPEGRCVPGSPGVKTCVRTGCSNQLCVDKTKAPVVTDCLFREEYACYQDAACEVQPNGECGFTPSERLNACLADVGKKPDLVITDVRISLVNDITCTEVGTLVVVKNQGTANAPSFTMSVNDSSAKVPPLAVGATYTTVVNGYRQDKNTEVILDTGDDVDETDESNNTFSRRLPIPTQPARCSPGHRPSVTPIVTDDACPNGAKKSLGDANGDCLINSEDFGIWRAVARKETRRPDSDADFDGNGKVDIFDYLIWLDSYSSGEYLP